MNIGFIGFGNMGSALGIALSKQGYSVYYSELEDKNLENIEYVSTEKLIDMCEYIILAIKPYLYEEVLTNYDFKNRTVISIAAGVTSTFMKRFTNNFVLTMPNTPSLINMGTTAIVKNEYCNNDVEKLFQAVGDIYYISEEELSKAICLTGSSPAYFFNFIDNLASSFEGMEKSIVEKNLAKVMEACAKMILASNDSCEQLTKNVCSPNGTTIQAVDTFNESLEELCNRAIDNCYKRAEEMKLK